MTGSDAHPRPLPLGLKILWYVLALTAFLTGVRFLPGIDNNIGPFEFTVGAMGILWAAGIWGRSRTLLHPISAIALGLVAVAVVSVLVVDQGRLAFPLVQLLMLATLAMFLVVTHNLVDRYRIPPEFLLNAIVWAIVLIGPWLIYDQIRGGTLSSVGPFRGRAHMGMYMATAFWLALTFLTLPGLSKSQRGRALVALAVALYGVAASGRRSVYLSLGLGLPACLFSLLVYSGGARARTVFVSGIILLFGSVLYWTDPTPQAEFFQERIWMVDDRITEVLGGDAEQANLNRLEQTQGWLQGARMAVQESPVIGIGWGAFRKSRFSPTGAEIHSTPLRFFAETGAIGLLLYLTFISVLLASAVRNSWQMRGTPFSTGYTVFAVALLSLSIGWLYNRHITERAFWLLLAVWFAFAVRARGQRPPVNAPMRRSPESWRPAAPGERQAKAPLESG